MSFVCTQFRYQTVPFNPYQVLPLWTSVDLGAMATKGYSAFSKALALLEPPHHIVGARGVIVIVVGNEHGDTSSNPGRDWLHFT